MKRRIFLDTNIIIDYLSGRIPFGEAAMRIFSLSTQYNQLCISALSFTTIYYVLRRYFEHHILLEKLNDLQLLVEVLPTDNRIISASIHSNFKDFEDGVQYYTALAGNASIIITRNPKDFANSVIPVYTPTEFLEIPFWMDDSDTSVVNEPEVVYKRKKPKIKTD